MNYAGLYANRFCHMYHIFRWSVLGLKSDFTVKFLNLRGSTILQGRFCNLGIKRGEEPRGGILQVTHLSIG